MLQSHLRNDLSRAGETESTGIERYVIEGRVVNLGVEIALFGSPITQVVRSMLP